MERIGAYLKNGRLAKGYSQEELARITKIPLKFIKAMEEERFSDLPEVVYVRGFIKSYCQEVGIEPDPVLGQLHTLLKKPANPKTITMDYGITLANERATLSDSNKHKSRFAVAAVFLVFFLGVLFILLAIAQHSNMKDVSQVTTPPRAQQTIPAATAPKEDPGPYFF